MRLLLIILLSLNYDVCTKASPYRYYDLAKNNNVEGYRDVRVKFKENGVDQGSHLYYPKYSKSEDEHSQVARGGRRRLHSSKAATQEPSDCNLKSVRNSGITGSPNIIINIINSKPEDEDVSNLINDNDLRTIAEPNGIAMEYIDSEETELIDNGIENYDDDDDDAVNIPLKSDDDGKPYISININYPKSCDDAIGRNVINNPAIPINSIDSTSTIFSLISLVLNPTFRNRQNDLLNNIININQLIRSDGSVPESTILSLLSPPTRTEIVYNKIAELISIIIDNINHFVKTITDLFQIVLESTRNPSPINTPISSLITPTSNNVIFKEIEELIKGIIGTIKKFVQSIRDLELVPESATTNTGRNTIFSFISSLITPTPDYLSEMINNIDTQNMILSPIPSLLTPTGDRTVFREIAELMKTAIGSVKKFVETITDSESSTPSISVLLTPIRNNLVELVRNVIGDVKKFVDAIKESVPAISSIFSLVPSLLTTNRDRITFKEIAELNETSIGNTDQFESTIIDLDESVPGNVIVISLPESLESEVISEMQQAITSSLQQLMVDDDDDDDDDADESVPGGDVISVDGTISDPLPESVLNVINSEIVQAIIGSLQQFMEDDDDDSEDESESTSTTTQVLENSMFSFISSPIHTAGNISSQHQVDEDVKELVNIIMGTKIQYPESAREISTTLSPVNSVIESSTMNLLEKPAEENFIFPVITLLEPTHVTWAKEYILSAIFEESPDVIFIIIGSKKQFPEVTDLDNEITEGNTMLSSSEILTFEDLMISTISYEDATTKMPDFSEVPLSTIVNNTGAFISGRTAFKASEAILDSVTVSNDINQFENSTMNDADNVTIQSTTTKDVTENVELVESVTNVLNETSTDAMMPITEISSTTEVTTSTDELVSTTEISTTTEVTTSTDALMSTTEISSTTEVTNSTDALMSTTEISTTTEVTTSTDALMSTTEISSTTGITTTTDALMSTTEVTTSTSNEAIVENLNNNTETSTQLLIITESTTENITPTSITNITTNLITEEAVITLDNNTQLVENSSTQIPPSTVDIGPLNDPIFDFIPLSPSVSNQNRVPSQNHVVEDILESNIITLGTKIQFIGSDPSEVEYSERYRDITKGSMYEEIGKIIGDLNRARIVIDNEDENRGSAKIIESMSRENNGAKMIEGMNKGSTKIIESNKVNQETPILPLMANEILIKDGISSGGNASKKPTPFSMSLPLKGTTSSQKDKYSFAMSKLDQTSSKEPIFRFVPLTISTNTTQAKMSTKNEFVEENSEVHSITLGSKMQFATTDLIRTDIITDVSENLSSFNYVDFGEEKKYTKSVIFEDVVEMGNSVIGSKKQSIETSKVVDNKNKIGDKYGSSSMQKVMFTFDSVLVPSNPTGKKLSSQNVFVEEVGKAVIGSKKQFIEMVSSDVHIDIQNSRWDPENTYSVLPYGDTVQVADIVMNTKSPSPVTLAPIEMVEYITLGRVGKLNIQSEDIDVPRVSWNNDAIGYNTNEEPSPNIQIDKSPQDIAAIIESSGTNVPASAPGPELTTSIEHLLLARPRPRPRTEASVGRVSTTSRPKKPWSSRTKVDRTQNDDVKFILE